MICVDRECRCRRRHHTVWEERLSKCAFLRLLLCTHPVCRRPASDHTRKKNCSNNPRCLYGLGEGKEVSIAAVIGAYVESYCVTCCLSHGRAGKALAGVEVLRTRTALRTVARATEKHGTNNTDCTGGAPSPTTTAHVLLRF